MRCCLVVVVVAGLCACGGDATIGDGDGGGNAGIDAGPDDPDAGGLGCSALPTTSPTWLATMQDDVLRTLTGIVDIGAAGRLTDRSTPSNRALTRQYLSDQLSMLGYTPRLDAYGSGTNVYGELAATVANGETIVVGAHFDSVAQSPGANDNATGVAMVLAAARYVRDIECRAQNFVFVLFDEEEVGLVGSSYFAQLLSNSGTPVSSVHTIDQNGWDQDGDRAVELERPDADLFARYSQAKAAAGMTMPLHQTDTGWTDHVSFRAHGFDAVGITEEFVNGDTTPHYHLSSDTYATVDQSYLASTTRLLFATLGREVQISTAAVSRTTENTVALDLRAAARLPRSPAPERPHGCRSRAQSPHPNQ